MSEKAFECKMCGHCCQGSGGIVVTLEEQERLSVYLGMSLSIFVREYTMDKGSRKLLITGNDGYCIFFGPEGCRVHTVKPDVCRAWPFFRGNLIDSSSWELSQDYCPGINPDIPFQTFVEQGLQYLEENGLLKEDNNDRPNALSNDDIVKKP